MNLVPATLLDDRLARLRLGLASSGCDALLVTRRPNVHYLANFTGTAGALLVTPADLFVIVDSRYSTEVEALLAGGHAPRGGRLALIEGSYDETMAALIGTSGAAVAGFEAEDVTFARHAWLRDHLPAVELRPTYGLVERLRECKDWYELELLREAAKALSAIAGTLPLEVREGRTEREVAGGVEQAMRSSGFSRPAFDTIVASGPNGALPHATAGNRVLHRGDLVVVDFGGVWEGYCVDMTRTLAVGPVDAEAHRVHAAVQAAQAAAIEAVRPGALTGDIDAAARGVLERYGIGAAFSHGTGHGLGLEVHEDPRITRRRPEAAATTSGRAPGHVPVEPGMVFTIEPGAYLPGWGGVRIEDDVLVTEDGCEVLTRPWGHALENENQSP